MTIALVGLPPYVSHAPRANTLQSVRKVLHDELVKLNPDKDWSFVTSQIGMFSFTGMTPKQVRQPIVGQSLDVSTQPVWPSHIRVVRWQVVLQERLWVASTDPPVPL